MVDSVSVQVRVSRPHGAAREELLMSGGRFGLALRSEADSQLKPIAQRVWKSGDSRSVSPPVTPSPAPARASPSRSRVDIKLNTHANTPPRIRPSGSLSSPLAPPLIPAPFTPSILGELKKLSPSPASHRDCKVTGQLSVRKIAARFRTHRRQSR